MSRRLYPARRITFSIDDKLRILTDVKAVWKERVTTVFPRQGHYARDPAILASCPPADIDIARYRRPDFVQPLRPSTESPAPEGLSAA